MTVWLLLSLTLAGWMPSDTAVAETPGQTQVFVVGTLYKRHERIAVYDLPALRQTILTIAPDVLVLDVTPDELRTRTVSPGKIEYPGVVFPLLDEQHYVAVPAEPAEPLFSEIVQAVIADHRERDQTRPATAAAIKQVHEATYAALAEFWRGPADVNSARTDRAFAATHALEASLLNEPDTYQQRWNEHWTAQILRAAREHPGKRILALVGIENRDWLNEHLRTEPGLTLVDVEPLLRRAP